MRFKLFVLLSLSIFVLVLFVGMISAVSLELELLTSTPITTDHGEDVTIDFKVSNNGVTNYSALDWSGSSASMGSWTALPTLTSLDVGETKDLSATLSVPEHASGVINAIIDLQSETTAQAQLEVNISINENLSLSVSGGAIPEGEDSVTIKLTNNGNVDLTGVELTYVGDFDVSFSDNNFNLIAGDEKDITVTITTPLGDLDVGSNSVVISVTADELTTPVTAIITTSGAFCDVGNAGDLDITIDDVNVVSGFGDSDDFWYPFDEIEMDLIVEPGKYDIDDIEVEWELQTEGGDKIDDDTESDFNLDEDDDDKELTISFKLDRKLNKLEGEGKLILFVRAKGEIDDKKAGLDDGADTCDWTSKEVDIRTDDEFVVLDDVVVPETASCGTDITVTADVWNIDDEDQDNVVVRITEANLGIDEWIEVGDIDYFDDKKLTANIRIPENAEEKPYTLVFKVLDEDKNIFENEEDDEARFGFPFDVQGPCGVAEPIVLVNALLESGGQAGKELVVRATITNTGDELASFELNAAGHAGWATLSEISPSILILNTQESKDVLFTFQVNRDASGENFFDIEIVSDNELIVSQPVAVTITELEGFGGNLITKENWYLWLIGLLNIILVIIIIVVAVRVSRK